MDRKSDVNNNTHVYSTLSDKAEIYAVVTNCKSARQSTQLISLSLATAEH